VWLRPGRYAVEVTSSATAVVALDGRTVLPDGATRADVTVGGHIHPLTVEVPAGGTLQAIAVRPVD
jgi:hypothetical protein